MKEFLTIKESAGLTGKSESLIYRYIRQGKLEVFTFPENLQGDTKEIKKIDKAELIKLFNPGDLGGNGLPGGEVFRSLEENALYRAGVLFEENRHLKEKIEYLTEENRELKDQIKSLTLSLKNITESIKGEDKKNLPSEDVREKDQPPVSLKPADINMIQLLKNIPLFSGLKEKDLWNLSKKVYKKNYEKDTIILHRGEKRGFLGILISGSLKVTILSLEGREMTFAILKPYNFVGEMSLLDDEPHSASVVALKKSKLLIIPGDVFYEMLKNNPDIFLFLLKKYVKLVRRLDEQISDLKFMDIYQRTAKNLVDMCGRDKDNTIEITHQELANLVGSTRENVSRSLS